MEIELMDQPSCFLCETDSGRPLFKVCRCDQLVHEECYLRLLRVPSHQTCCAVCRAVYDIDVRRGYRFRWIDGRSRVLLFLSVALLASVIACLGLNACGECFGDEWLHSQFIVNTIGSFALILTIILIGLNKLFTRRWFCCALRKVVVKRQIRTAAFDEKSDAKKNSVATP
jgi:hypothetical protein